MTDNCRNSRLLLKGGRIVSEAGLVSADLVVSEGKIVKWVDSSEASSEDRINVVDVRHCLLLPGGIDPHVHFEFPFSGTNIKHDAFSGGQAALLAGTTLAYDFILDSDGSKAPAAALVERAEYFRQTPLQVKFHYCFVNEHEKVADYIRCLADLDIKVALFGFYHAWSEAAIERYMPLFAADKLMLGLHALEDEKAVDSSFLDCTLKEFIGKRQRYDELEATLFTRYSQAAKAHGVPFYAFHLSNPKLIAQQPAGGRLVREVAVQHLFYNLEGLVARENGHYLMCGPYLQTRAKQQELIEQLGRIDIVASDSAALDVFDKRTGSKIKDIRRGLPSLGYRLPMLYTFGIKTGRLDWKTFLDVWCGNAAKWLGDSPSKGTLLPGADADIVVIEPGAIIRNQNPADRHLGWQPFLDRLDGWPRDVFVGGRHVVRQGMYTGS
ncbi:amidohydrolase family protein [Brevibacillus sp. B_LB10_24]|uniref:amidohydrolase family protein n=1 Tax=Brevibacillus sp. B_LB10_24 TaxID=3380645 RepID=UPI0038BA5920